MVVRQLTTAGGCLLLVAATVWAQGASRYLVTPRSAGPVRLGMTVAQAQKALPAAEFERTSDGEGLALIEVRVRGKVLLSLYTGEEDPSRPIDRNRKIELIEVLDPGFRTAEGLYPGMQLSEAEKKCGKIREIELSEIESREYVRFPRGPKRLTLRAWVPKGGFAGEYSKNATPPAKTRRYRKGAVIASIILPGG